MSEWSLTKLLGNLHEDISQRLAIARQSFGHSGTKGDASESLWVELLDKYLPQRYRAARAHVVDSQGNFSQQIDVVIFDRQYSPFIFNFQDALVVPAESVYAVFEAKQTADASHVAYAKDKADSVRRLHRTSLPIPHAGGVYPAKVPGPILAGLLTLESSWSPPMGKAMEEALSSGSDQSQLDIGCIAAHGIFVCSNGSYTLAASDKAATMFLFELIARLQMAGTVPMIDVGGYARWLQAPPAGKT